MKELIKYDNNDVAVVEENLEKLKEMSISEIDAYGSDIQRSMTDSSSNILEKAKMIELGTLSEELDELSDITKKHKKLLPILQTPLSKLRRYKNRFIKVQSRIDQIEESLENQKQKIEVHTAYMEEQIGSLKTIIRDLRICEDTLLKYSEEIESDTDQIRFQAVSSRLRTINNTRIIAEQAQAEALMILCEQREAKIQLEEVIKNALPAIQIQAVNSVGIRVNKETQDIISKTRDITSNIIVQNATEVKNMAIELQKNRTKSIVDDEKLAKAQSILTEAMQVIAKASEVEAETNVRLTKSLREKAKDNTRYIEMLSDRVDNSN